MARSKKLTAFYTSRLWRDVANKIKIERGGKCEACGFTAVNREDWARLIAHHRIELTDEAVDDPNIALNPDNIEILCLDCHNKQHRRFGYNQHHVYIVWGSPLSGKSSAVRELMQRGDLIIDMDRLFEAVSMMPPYDKPNELKLNLFQVRDNLLEQVKRRYGNWHDAYIIGGYPRKFEREQLAAQLGADLLYIESTKEECLRRRSEDKRPQEWDEYIERWWEDFLRAG